MEFHIPVSITSYEPWIFVDFPIHHFIINHRTEHYPRCIEILRQMWHNNRFDSMKSLCCYYWNYWNRKANDRKIGRSRSMKSELTYKLWSVLKKSSEWIVRRTTKWNRLIEHLITCKSTSFVKRLSIVTYRCLWSWVSALWYLTFSSISKHMCKSNILTKAKRRKNG